MAINELESVRRLKTLEKYIDSNIELKNKIENLLLLQKQMINCKQLELVNAYNDYKEQYSNLKESILLIPFVEEYLELLDENHLMLKNIFKIIEH